MIGIPKVKSEETTMPYKKLEIENGITEIYSKNLKMRECFPKKTLTNPRLTNPSLFNIKKLDISDLSNPTFKGSYNGTYGAFPTVALSGNYIYVAEAHSGLQIIDISDPEKSYI